MNKNSNRVKKAVHSKYRYKMLDTDLQTEIVEKFLTCITEGTMMVQDENIADELIRDAEQKQNKRNREASVEEIKRELGC
jgi:anti-sigma28 factor (negative regulator of flagellin synthesis)